MHCSIRHPRRDMTKKITPVHKIKTPLHEDTPVLFTVVQHVQHYSVPTFFSQESQDRFFFFSFFGSLNRSYFSDHNVFKKNCGTECFDCFMNNGIPCQKVTSKCVKLSSARPVNRSGRDVTGPGGIPWRNGIEYHDPRCLRSLLLR